MGTKKGQQKDRSLKATENTHTEVQTVRAKFPHSSLSVRDSHSFKLFLQEVVCFDKLTFSNKSSYPALVLTFKNIFIVFQIELNTFLSTQSDFVFNPTLRI